MWNETVEVLNPYEAVKTSTTKEKFIIASIKDNTQIFWILDEIW